MTENCVYSIPCICGKQYKVEKTKFGGISKIRSEIMKSGMADYAREEKGNHQPLWNELNVMDKENTRWLDIWMNR